MMVRLMPYWPPPAAKRRPCAPSSIVSSARFERAEAD